MPRKYPAEVRRQVIELARSGTKVAQLAETFGMSDATIYNWLKQDKVDRGEIAEVAEYEAARLLQLELSPVRQPGYDATRTTPDRDQLLQIKGRCIDSANSKSSQRVGRIDLEKPWNAVLLVLLDEHYNPHRDLRSQSPEGYRGAYRTRIESPQRSGQLSISKFKSIGRQIWPN